MIRSTLALAVSLSLLAGCSSSSSSASKDCVSGTYAVTIGGPAHEAGCPDMALTSATWTYTVSGTTLIYPAPPASEATPDPGNSADERTCSSHTGFTLNETPDPGCPATHTVFDIEFDSTGIIGTTTISACASSGGTTTTLICTYDVTGVRK